ncbi:hypothetical protein BO94DRAFT_570687 [Aspergillus sclerotioniger CBS 115572]|uniref:Uncharacterized protein n=1 Tax=Aspergillus sclerotioniger CBS 115572 TaxID=1450535 RepID=A0A317XDG1_9EURO|nr:hypothetical protein BO94DRAFT_570687 [Aspergillus sclerotioniger CBS 115572]PWY96365.1 hypothetical protein BO94DRAFT_570687 [Aspergillus sclerotioniger CBS 115572]
MTNSNHNSHSILMRRVHKMKSLSSLFPCLQARKLRRQRRQDYHASWTCAGISELAQTSELSDAHEHEKHYEYDHAPQSEKLTALPDQPHEAATKTPQTTSSIRIVRPEESECSTLEFDDLPQDQEPSAKQTNTLSDEETDVECSPKLPQKVITMTVGPQTEETSTPRANVLPQSKDDIDLELSSRRIPRSPDKKPRPASMDVPPSAVTKLPEIKSRIIEDIPEDVEEEAKQNVNVAGSEEEQDLETTKPAKRSSAWRLSQRKSMVEIFNLLQSTAAAVASAPKRSNIKLPKSLRPSPAPEPSSPRPPTPPPKSPTLTTESDQPSTAAPTLTTPSSSPTKKQRRMGTAVFPLPHQWPETHEDITNIKTNNQTLFH